MNGENQMALVMARALRLPTCFATPVVGIRRTSQLPARGSRTLVD